MTAQPTQRLSVEEIVALKFAAHRQLARWSNKPQLSSQQHARRSALKRAVRIIQDNTELRHRWLVAERRCSGSGWCMHDGDHATLHDARAYVQSATDITPTGEPSPHNHRTPTQGEEQP